MDLNNWSSLSPALRSWHWNRKGLSSVINILAQALYSLFGAEDENLEVLREGCFKYFEMGGECVNGPVSLLSGLAPRPMLLVGHFFAVALYSIYSLFVHPRYFPAEDRTRTPSVLEYPGLVWRSIMVFYTACVVLLPVVFTEMKSNVPRLNPTASSRICYRQLWLGFRVNLVDRNHHALGSDEGSSHRQESVELACVSQGCRSAAVVIESRALYTHTSLMFCRSSCIV